MWKTLCLALLCTAAGDEFLSRKGATRARCLLQGWANNAQANDLVNVAQDCFTPQTAASSSSSEGAKCPGQCPELSAAMGCVVRKLEQLWGWRPELVGSGSNTGGPYDVQDAGLTLVGVETPSGSWQFMLRRPQAGQARGSGAGSSHVTVDVHSHHRGDASEQQEADLIRFAESCFSNTKTDLDTSDLGSLKLTLGNSVDCVLQKCLEAWGFKPKESVYGSDTGAHAYSLGATVIGVESPSGKWDFVLWQQGARTEGDICRPVESFVLSGFEVQAGKYTVYDLQFVGFSGGKVRIHEEVNSLQHMTGTVTVVASLIEVARPSDVLRHVLRIGWRLGAACIIIECTADMTQHSHFLHGLHAFAKQAGFRLTSCELELGLVWASRRNRLWYGLVPSSMPSFSLRPFPEISPLLCIQDVIPEWPVWPEQDESALQWPAELQEKLTDSQPGPSVQLLDAKSQAPTARHSWGNTLSPCPCNCRSQGISAERLLNEGFTEVGVHSGLTSQPRFLHPQEVALLNTLTPRIRWAQEVKAGLCLVGSASAPMQAVWIFAQLGQWAAEHFHETALHSPAEALADLKGALLQDAKDCLSVPSLLTGGHVLVQCMQTTQACPLPPAQQPWKANMLTSHLHASLGPGYSIAVWDADRALPGEAFLHPCGRSTPYIVRIRQKKQTAQEGSLPALPGSAPKPAVSDGQLNAALAEINSSVPASVAHCLPCSLATVLLTAGQSWDALGFPLHTDSPKVASVYAADGHWACLGFKVLQPGSVKVFYLDGVSLRVLKPAQRLCQILAAAYKWQVTTFESCTWFPQTGPEECGYNALQHALAFIHDSPEGVPERAASLLQKHKDAPALFRAAGQLSAEQCQKLSTLLVEHGVPQSAVEERITAAVNKIGAPIAKALALKQCWPQLKHLGSQPGHAFRWIQQDELQAHIEAKAHAKFGTAVANAKAKKRKDKEPRSHPVPLQVDPAKLLITPGSFVTEDDRPLPQLAFAEVGHQTQGVAFCSAQQALPFLQAYQSLSVDALALVCVTELPNEACGSAPVESLQFPAVYGPTDEAILIRGSLIQIGDEPVHLAHASIAEAQHLETLTCRISVYRDELALDWRTLTEGPIKALLQHLPALTLCGDKACAQNCGRFHPAVEEAGSVDRLILDLWSRQWSKLEGGRASASEAQAFHCMIRVPSSALSHLQQIATRGFYAEPRAPGGTGPHPGFAVIWLPEADYAKALHSLRTCAKAIAVARLGKRYGVRVREVDEQGVFEALRPGCDFAKVLVKAHYRLHPLPFGCQRKQLHSLLRGWKWSAKPLQPARGDAEGAAWIVGACEDPPAPALTCGDSYVLVRKVRDTALQQPPSAVTASNRTKRSILQDDDDADPDPWANGQDPWALARAPPGLPAPATSSTTTSKFEQLRSELATGVTELVQQQVSASAQAVSDHTSAHDARLAKLETTVHELQLQGTKFESWFQSFGQQVSTVQTAVAAQQSEIAQVKQEVSQQADSVQKCVQAAVGSLGLDISSQLQKQLEEQSSRLEALLAKKQRAE
ncbi:unnamed protein product [Symbiodinium sp. CCMP2456]|nr:unnamed protein product [Symbiodinium sp. CCMP2456]